MIMHLSMRVPWRDQPWNEGLCARPLDNSSCLLLRDIAGSRNDDYEVAHALEDIGRGLLLPGLTCHSDAGSQFTSIRYGERLAEIGAVPSIGSIGDSFDNALAETVNGSYKAELIYGPARSRPWKTVEDVELATLGWVHWHNTTRLHGYLNDLPPAEFEAAFYDAQRSDQPLVGIQ